MSVFILLASVSVPSWAHEEKRERMNGEECGWGEAGERERERERERQTDRRQKKKGEKKGGN